MKFFVKNGRSLFYGLTMALGTMFLQQISINSGADIVILATMLLSLILILEIFTTYSAAAKLLKQLDLPDVEIYTKGTQFVYHLLLPELLLFGLAGFIYSNNQVSLIFIYFMSSFLLFSMLFINIRAYYEDKFKLEEQTHIVYDLIKLFLFFTLTNSILNLANRYDFNFFIVAGLGFVVSSLLTLLIMLRYRYLNYMNLLLLLLSGLIVGYAVGVLDDVFANRGLVSSVYATLVFYIFNAILHHQMEKTLRLSLVVEYFLVATISLLLIFLVP